MMIDTVMMMRMMRIRTTIITVKDDKENDDFDYRASGKDFSFGIEE